MVLPRGASPAPFGVLERREGLLTEWPRRLFYFLIFSPPLASSSYSAFPPLVYSTCRQRDLRRRNYILEDVHV